MSKAEERAEEAYKLITTPPNPADVAAYYNAALVKLQEAYIGGYKQAEKDLGWISVEDKLPAPSEWVVVCIEQHGHAQCLALATYNYETDEWHTADFEDGEQETVYVEYWMSIPNIIKEAKK